MIEPAGGRFTYAYDSVGRNTLVVNPQGDRTTMVFDAAGRNTCQKLATGGRASLAYDDAGRLLRLSNLKSDGTTLSSFRDTWDAANNRTARTESSGILVTWSYDNTYQLLRERRSGANAYDVTYTYDAAGNRGTKLEGGTRSTYTYDSANQLSTAKAGASTTTFACARRRRPAAPRRILGILKIA
jgi:YD repeat-containing protein